jgi:hypothetical protein
MVRGSQSLTQMKLENVHLATLSLEDLSQPEIGPSVLLDLGAQGRQERGRRLLY